MTHKTNSPHRPFDDPTSAEDAGQSAAAAAQGGQLLDPAVDLSGDAVSADPVTRLQAELADQQDKLLRLAADFDNFRKRTVRDRQAAELQGMATVMRGLLDALDDLGRFAHVDPTTVDAATVVEGADMVEKKVFKSLAGHGLEVVNPLGEPFDPTVHEAVSTVRAELPEEDHRVAQVFQVGYVLNGQLLRPARVVVAQWHEEP